MYVCIEVWIRIYVVLPTPHQMIRHVFIFPYTMYFRLGLLLLSGFTLGWSVWSRCDPTSGITGEGMVWHRWGRYGAGHRSVCGHLVLRCHVQCWSRCSRHLIHTIHKTLLFLQCILIPTQPHIPTTTTAATTAATCCNVVSTLDNVAIQYTQWRNVEFDGLNAILSHRLLLKL